MKGHVKRATLVLLALALSFACGWRLGVGGVTTSAGHGHADMGVHIGIEPDAPTVETDLAYTAWDEDSAPEYYRIVGPASIDDDLEVGTATYAPLDALGRAGRVAACVDHRMMEAGRMRSRGSLSGLSPSGWGHNAEVDVVLPGGGSYHGYLWNRSHLLAKSLGGMDELENLVCGTRMQNVGSNAGGGGAGGMAYCEGLARNWLEAHSMGTVTYVATPVYEGDELVCRSVIVDMRSSDGSIDQRVEVYNAAKGYVIDYADGSFAPVGD